MEQKSIRFSILFLFWSITHLAKRIISSHEEPKTGELIAILGSGLIGGLAYAFSDTFWFSAVEAEVYATSSFFTAIVFWAILKWENIADEPYANRWLILILYLFGLSIGIHLLNLLAIPAIVFIYYYKKYKVTPWGIFWTLALSALILGFILYGIIPGAVIVASWFELIFVNGLGLPYHSGVFFYLLLLVAAIAFGVWYTHKKRKVLWNTVILGIAVILIGYSTYMIIPIRSSANPPMDQNSPDNVFSLLSFLNREQYGDRPLFYGQYYNSPLDNKNPYVDDKVQRVPKDGKYVVSQMRKKSNYNDDYCTVFPRMWSKTDTRHIDAYKEWARIRGIRMPHRGPSGETEVIEKPTFSENMRFFFRYQVGFMYWRYFMWNFAGRQNDLQSHGELLNGNWISGIKFIDEARLGSQSNLPSKYADNWGRNKYYFLPLILGIIGIFFQYRSGRQGKRDLWVVFLLFFMPGLAIVLYLNQSPLQPRERDYAYAGSFYAFAIWIGLGVAALYQWLKKYMPQNATAIVVTGATLLAVPVLMASENWDDHDRSLRTSARDFGYNYLATLDPQGVIFTNGDNDTYPLWYNQEVEGVGTDLRVCNLSYFQTDWYVAQMQRKAYESEPLPISFTYDQYVQGTRDVVYIVEDPRFQGRSIELGRALEFVKSDHPDTKITRAENAAYLPVRNLFMVVDKEAVIANKVVPPDQYDQIVDTLYIQLGGSYISKDQLMMLDMLYNNNWKRPLYFAISVGSDKYLSLDKYFRLEGFAYRIVPVLTNSQSFQRGFVASDVMYNNMMNKFKYGNLAHPKVYVDENNSRMLNNLRNNFLRLAETLHQEGKRDSSIKVIDKCFEVIPPKKVSYDYFSVELARLYYMNGAAEKANALVQDMTNEFDRELNYYYSLKPKFFNRIEGEVRAPIYFLNELYNMSQQYGEEQLKSHVKAVFEKYYSQLNMR